MPKIYIEDSDIQATMKAARYTSLTADTGAIDFAVDKTNGEIYSILGKEYDTLNDVPENIRELGGVIGRYWLFSFNEALDTESHIASEYLKAIQDLVDIATGKQSGLDDPDDATDNPVQYSSKEREFDRANWEAGNV